MAELDLGKVVMDSYNDLDDKPSINGVELKGYMRTSQFGIDQALEAVNVAREAAYDVHSLEYFVEHTANDVDVPRINRMFVNSPWGPFTGITYCRYLIAYENEYGIDPALGGYVKDVNGSGIFWEDEGNVWWVKINGNVGTLTITYKKLEQNQVPTNNLLATEPGTPLDAVQGKVLNDRCTAISEELSISTNVLPGILKTDMLDVDFTNSTADKNKVHRIGTADASKLINSPITSGNFYGKWECIFYGVGSGGYRLMVKITEFHPVPGRVWFNHYNWTAWTGWQKLVTETELNNGLTSIKVYNNTDFQTVADSVPINKKLTCRMLGRGDSAVTGLPLDQLFIVEIYAISEATVIATAYAAESGNMYVKRKSGGNWQGWEKKTNTVS